MCRFDFLNHCGQFLIFDTYPRTFCHSAEIFFFILLSCDTGVISFEHLFDFEDGLNALLHDCRFESCMQHLYRFIFVCFLSFADTTKRNISNTSIFFGNWACVPCRFPSARVSKNDSSIVGTNLLAQERDILLFI